MIKVNSLSGGKTSSYIAANYPADYNVFSLVRTDDKKCMFPDAKLRQEVSDRLGVEFIGTLEEDTIIYTMLDLEQFIGSKIDWVTGKTFDKSIITTKKGTKYLPNKMARYCTTELKTLPILHWMYDVVKEPVIMRFGYRANETRRAIKMMDKTDEDGFTKVKATFTKLKDGRNSWGVYKYCKPEFPLINDNIYKDTIEEFWKEKDVRFAYMNNCVGCWWRSPLLLKKMHNKHPEKMQWFADQETNKSKWRSDIRYKEIIKWKTQTELFDDDFNECDSGYCGL
tara:strand:- start:1543 stop:2388 length:846 start_codon:yes stop_codon:yes gene_type:complete